MSRAGLVLFVASAAGVMTTATDVAAAPLRLGFDARALKLPVSAAFDARDDLKAAYNKALGQYNNLELDAAKSTLESALSGAAPDDPATAPLRMLNAVIIFSNTGKADETTAAFIDAVRADYNVGLPADLRSPDLQKLLDKARKSSGVTAPTDAIQHTAPSTEDVCGKDIVFSALARQVPEGGQVVLYWRQAGGGEFKTSTMDTFGNFATVTVTASDHGDQPVEYFFYIFDSANKDLGNRGDQENPLKLDIACKKEVVEAPKEVEAPKPKSTLPRVFINLGIGTGAGIARGVADQSYKQLSPVDGYTPADFACSLARWQAGSENVPDAAGFANSLTLLNPAQYGPYTASELSLAYNQDNCAEHHPVKAGFASAPFHVAPEIGFRIGRALVLSVFGRLQLVTGSKVYRDDPTLDLATSYNEEVRSPMPAGVRTKPGFTGAGGLKIQYVLGKDDKKFRLFVGGVLGGGFARLRVPMGFANDRNGNSVPDDREVAAGTNLGQCQPVWPYGGACDPATAASEAMLAGTVKAGADTAQRVDTVRVGGGFIGVTFGFNYQVAKHFALFAEIQPTVWFPKTTSFMLDFAFGPVITF